MTPEFIIDVNEIDFEYEVISYSQNVPVIVDFWAEWCRPCKTISPILERLAIEANGSFRLAKVDIDKNPNLALRFGIRSIPTVKAFTQGNITSEFVGLMPENRIRDFVNNIKLPSQQNLAIEKANSLLVSNQWKEAEILFRELLENAPYNTECLLGLLKSLLGQGIVNEAIEIIDHFPSSKSFQDALRLLPLAEEFSAYFNDLLNDNDDLGLAYKNSIRLAINGNYLSALDGLFGILKIDKSYQEGIARKVALSILDLMGDENKETRHYRTELASILF